MKNPDLLFRNPDFLLKNVGFLVKKQAGLADGEDAATACALLQRADDDGDGRVTLDEFLACFAGPELIGEVEEKVARKRSGGCNDSRMRKIRELFASVDKGCKHGSA